MTIDFSQKFTNPLDDNKPIDISGGKHMTLGYVATDQLLASDRPACMHCGRSETTPQGDKLERYRVGYKILTADGQLELKIEDVALVKAAIGKHPSPLIVGQAFQMLERE